jgi:hypothetical protein
MKHLLIVLLASLTPDTDRVVVDVETSEGWETYGEYTSETEAKSLAVKMYLEGIHQSQIVAY